MFVNPAEWHEICTKMFTTVGVPEEDAGLVADTALTADIRGVAWWLIPRLPLIFAVWPLTALSVCRYTVNGFNGG